MGNPVQQEKHPHIPARRLLDRIVLGGSDGAIEGLAMTAALNGAGLGFGTILLAGFAFAVAGSVSMFFSTYLSNKSELDLLMTDVQREKMEIETEPEEERAEMEQLLMKDGYDQQEVKTIMERLLKDKELWLKEMLRRELRINIEDLETDPFVRPASAGLAFFLLALLALVPYALSIQGIVALGSSVVLCLAAQFALSSRIFIPGHFKPVAGLESALIGGVAGGLLYLVGILISRV
jgi:VIT1/CCC1 family predicted Fe2+/Mn2+ transporter